MIRDCQNGKIDYIITKSVSRFARNTVECLEYVRSLKAQGIGIFFEEQNIDTLKNESELYLVIVSLHVGGGVVLHTKTETDICESEDKPNGSPENSETDSFRN